MRARVVGFALVPVGEPLLTFPAHAPNRKRGREVASILCPFRGVGRHRGVIHVRAPQPSVGARVRTAMLYTPPPAARAVELTAKQMFMLFPTPMFTGKLPDIGLCNRIEKKLRELQQSGKGTSSREGQILAYMTPDDIHTLPEMKELVDVVMWESGKILDAYAVQRDAHYISNMWANIANPNRRHHDDIRFAAPADEKSGTHISAKERAQFRPFHYSGREGAHVDLAQPRSTCGRAGHGRRKRGAHRRRLQHHDPRAHPTVHGEFGLELTDFHTGVRRPG